MAQAERQVEPVTANMACACGDVLDLVTATTYVTVKAVQVHEHDTDARPGSGTVKKPWYTYTPVVRL